MSTNPSPISNISDSAPRCQHRFANYKQCRLLPAAGSSFCPQHANLSQAVPTEIDLSAILLKQSQDFQTAQGVNFSLASLSELLAKNRISSRRAATLAYIASLILRTHSAIDYDRKNDIRDPRAIAPQSPWPPINPGPAKKPS